MATFNAGDIQATATLDRTPFQRSLDAAIREGRAFNGMKFTAVADLDYRLAGKKLGYIQAQLNQYARQRYNATVGINNAGGQALAGLRKQLANLGGGKNLQINASLNPQPVLQALQRIEAAGNRTADSIGSGFTSRFQKIKFGAIFGGITLGAAAAGPILTGLAGGLGAAAISARGLGDALEAYGQDQKNADKVAAAGAATARSNATAIRNAQEAIADARKAAGRAAEDNAERAQQAYQSEVRAAQDVIEAQEAITRARKEATRALEDAQEKSRDFALDLNGAIIAQKRAVEERDKVMANGASTDLDRAEAQQNVAEAVERVNDLLDEHRRDQEDLVELEKKGVEGSDQVVNAKKQEADAEERLRDAMHESEIARRDAARSQADSAEAVARAVRGLHDIQAEQGAAAEAAAAKNDAFADALNKLSPAGQRMVKVLLSLKDNYDRLTSETQSAVFPGLMRMLDSLPSVEAEVTGGFKAIGGAISDVGDHATEVIENPFFQGQLQQSLENAAPIVEAVGDAVVDVAADLVKFGSTSQPIVEGVTDAIGSLEDGTDRFFTNVQPESRAAGQTIASFGQIVEDTLGGAGTVAGQFFDMWAGARDKVEPVVREIIDVFTKFTAGGFDAFGDDMKIILDVVNGALHVVEPFAKIFGGIAGDVLAARLAFKLLAGPIGGIVGLIGKIRPVNIAANILGALPGFAKAGVEIDKTTGKLSQNTSGLSKNQIQWGKVGGKVAEAGKYIPIIGLAIAGVSEIIDQAIPDLDDVGNAFLDGGQAAADAYDKMRPFMDGTADFSDGLASFGPSYREATEKARQLYNAMTPLQQAEQNNTKASNDYQYALKKFGDQSIVTREAAEKYRATTQELKQAQWEAEQATKSHTDKIREQQDAMLEAAGSEIGFERAQIRVKESQDALTQAIAEHGATSKEARDAEFEYKQALLDSVTAAGSLADAQTSLLSPTEQQAAHLDAVNRQLITLSAQAGTALPPEIQKLVNSFTDAQWAAYGVTYKTDEMGNHIADLPPQTPVDFTTNAPAITGQIDSIAGAVGRVAGSYRDWANDYINLIQTMINNPVPTSAAGTPAGFGFVGNRAYGGNLNIGQPTVVGEVGPELIFPDRAAFVATAAASKAILNGVSVGSNGAARTDNTDVVQAIYAMMGLLAGGLRASFDAGSLETGLIRAERRRAGR